MPLHRLPIALALGSIALCCVLPSGACSQREDEPTPAAIHQPQPKSPASSRSTSPEELDGDTGFGRSPTITPGPRFQPPPPFDPSMTTRWIAAAGGAMPELNHVSLEQNMALVAEVLGPGGRVLFGAGPGSPTVQFLRPPGEEDPVRLALGDLFLPRGARDVRYRNTILVHSEPATADKVLSALDVALGDGPAPLLLYLGGHGEMGAQPRDNVVSLWGQSAIRVSDLVTRLEKSPRPARLVVTTCSSGGFAEVIFVAGDASKGASPNERCGLFAAPWDLEATGCDPTPDRTTQHGYGLHVLEALRGHDRSGKILTPDEIDYDGDGRISLLEAHTRARIASESADVPTSTAERWLRHAAPTTGRQAPVALPEEDAVVEALARRLDLVGREAEAYLDLERLDDDLEALGRALEQAQLDEDAAHREAATDLLARWPVLDDPWHPDHPWVLREQHETLTAHLERSPTYLAFVDARARVDQLNQRSWELRQTSAPYERLTRALDNRTLAARLHARGGDDWATFERILQCERGSP